MKTGLIKKSLCSILTAMMCISGSAPITNTIAAGIDDGYFFTSTFEDGIGSWKGRGNASVEITGQSYYSYSKSLAVTGRTDS